MERLCRPAIVDRRRAFTLVELLVVVGVIALLIAMLLPVLSRARRAANNAACLSNLRQVHQSFHLYALDHRDAVPLGYRSATKQFNSMIYSITTAPPRWVLFGLLIESGHIADPRVVYCPAESNPMFMYDTPDNPWPPYDAAPATNIQSGYGSRPEHRIADDLSGRLPRLTEMKNLAIFADLTAARVRVITRHVDGINVLYGHGGAQWVPLDRFDQPQAQWAEPVFPLTDHANSTHDAIWAALDRH